MAGLIHGADRASRNFRRIVGLLIGLVIVPTGLLLVLGILMLVFNQAELNLLFGILVMALVACLVTGTVLSLVFLSRQASLSKLQTDFVSKVSHELRTPLTSIRMFAEMLKSEQDPEQVQLCLDVLEQETVRLSDRIERLLDWGRMEAGRRVYDFQQEAVETIVEDALRAFDTAFVGRTEGVSLDLAEDLPEVMADRGAMVDALVNLLSNAWKYSGDGRKIRLRARKGARHVRISVEDNGMGIARADHGRVFQKFYRVDDRLAGTVQGSGLGLPIVRHVVQAHGGRVELQSEVGRGSTFTILLPYAASRSAMNEEAEARRAV